MSTNKMGRKVDLQEFYQRIYPYLGQVHSSFTPVGTIIPVMSNHAPAHYLICDGSLYNIEDYLFLAKHFEEEYGNMNYFGGNGTTNFAVPDLTNATKITADTVNTSAKYCIATKNLFKDNIYNSYLRITDLGTEYTAELKNDISSGKFEKAVVGGKLTINGHVYYFAHPDYWLHTGDTECTTHHMVVVPAGNLAEGKMNNSDTTSSGYVGSLMRSSSGALETAKAIIKADFGASNILTHREFLTNAVSSANVVTGDAWYDSDIDLMNEQMVYGGMIFTQCINGTAWPRRYTINKSQLKLFAERPDLITTRSTWWLRDVTNSTGFANVSGAGYADFLNASLVFGVRPAFGIC